MKCLHAHYAWYLAGGDDPVGRWVAARLASPTAPPMSRSRSKRADHRVRRIASAAIDCGTNSTRLLVAELDDDGTLRAHRAAAADHPTRPGRRPPRRARPDAVDRTVAVLREYREVMDATA